MKLLVEATAQHMVELAMSGVVTSAEEARSTLQATCDCIGSAAIIKQIMLAEATLRQVQ